jgi:hypothetical protein
MIVKVSSERRASAGENEKLILDSTIAGPRPLKGFHQRSGAKEPRRASFARVGHHCSLLVRKGADITMHPYLNLLQFVRDASLLRERAGSRERIRRTCARGRAQDLQLRYRSESTLPQTLMYLFTPREREPNQPLLSATAAASPKESSAQSFRGLLCSFPAPAKSPVASGFSAHRQVSSVESVASQMMLCEQQREICMTV